jgi:hypothetical protein
MGMKRAIAGLLAVLALAAVAAETAMADERFVPEGYAYTPDRTKLPPVNSPAYKIIVEADRREAEIHTSKKLRADHEDWVIYNLQRVLHPPRNGWRRY